MSRIFVQVTSRMATCCMAIALLCTTAFGRTATYHVSPQGDNANPGTSLEAPWKSIDRGQPAFLLDDIQEGDAVIRLSKASQFPERGTLRIGADLVVSYTGRTSQTVTGCEGVETRTKGATVVCPEAPPPLPGDLVVVSPGVYQERLADQAPDGQDPPLAVVMIRSGGSRDNPVTFKGQPGVVVDGHDEILAVGLNAPYVVFEGFELRRGGMRMDRAHGSAVRNGSVHGGKKSLGAHYCTGVEISGNVVYDMVGAWSESGINLIGCAESVVAHNTVVANHNSGIFVSRGTGNLIASNLVA